MVHGQKKHILVSYFETKNKELWLSYCITKTTAVCQHAAAKQFQLSSSMKCPDAKTVSHIVSKQSNDWMKHSMLNASNSSSWISTLPLSSPVTALEKPTDLLESKSNDK